MHGFDSLLALGRAAWPQLTLDAAVFEQHVAARAGKLEPSQLQIEDLYLACACLHARPFALELFDTEHLSRVEPVIRRIEPSAAFVDEVRQQVRQKLFMPPPRIAEYSGHGPLQAWLRATAARVALNALRPDARHALVDVDELEVLPIAGPDPALAILKGRHRESFRSAFAKALTTLSTRDRTALKLNALDGVSLEKLGAMYGVDKSSVSRWLSRAQAQLLEQTRSALQAELGLEPSEVESLMAALQSQLQSSIGRLLAEK